MSARWVFGASGALPIETDCRLGQVGSCELRVRDDELGERRDEHAHRRAFLLDVAQPARRIELRLVEAGEAHLHRVVDERDAGEREHRRAVEPAAPGPVRLVVRNHRDVAVPDRDALGQACRARRVHHVGKICRLPTGTWNSLSSSLRTIVPVDDAVAGRSRADQHAQSVDLARDLLGGGEQRRAGELERDLGVPEDRHELGEREPGVRRDDDSAGLVHRGVGDDPAQDLIGGEEDRDAVAGPGRRARRALSPGGSTRGPTRRRSAATRHRGCGTRRRRGTCAP